MTYELTKTFFDTFGIEPRDNFKGCESGITFYTYGCNMPSCKGCLKEIREKEYPQITDSILLELICIVTNHTDIIRGFATVENLKTFVLEELIYDIAQMKDENTKHQVRTLFEEG